MKKRMRKFCFIIIIFIVYLIMVCAKTCVKAIDFFPQEDLFGDNFRHVGQEYAIGYSNLTTNKYFNCVAKGKHLKDLPDTYIVDSTFYISAGNKGNALSYIGLSNQNGYLRLITQDIRQDTLDSWNSSKELKTSMFELQYILCNNVKGVDDNGYYEKGYSTSRQNVVWNYWNTFASNVQNIIYSHQYVDAIEAIDSIRDNYDSGNYNLNNEAEIYSNILKKDETNIAAKVEQNQKKSESEYNWVKFKYSGIVVGIYDVNENAIDAYEFKNGIAKKINLTDWNVGNNTEKTIYVKSGIKNIKIRVASTDTQLYLYHLQNESVYNNVEGHKNKVDGWGFYDGKMGQDLIASYYQKSKDKVLNVSFDGSTPGGGHEIVTITDTRYNIRVKKMDTDTENGIGGVSIKLTTNLDGVYTEYIKITDQNGIAYFEGGRDGLYPGTYDVYEQNPNEGYIKNELYVGQIQVGQSCGWIYNAGNVDGLDLGNDDKVVVFIIKNKKATRNITVTKLDVETRERIPRNCIRFNKIKC